MANLTPPPFISHTHTHTHIYTHTHTHTHTHTPPLLPAIIACQIKLDWFLEGGNQVCCENTTEEVGLISNWESCVKWKTSADPRRSHQDRWGGGSARENTACVCVCVCVCVYSQPGLVLGCISNVDYRCLCVSVYCEGTHTESIHARSVTQFSTVTLLHGSTITVSLLWKICNDLFLIKKK